MARYNPKKLLTNRDWAKIKTRYQLGERVNDIAADFNYKASNICRKARQEGWTHNELQDVTVARVDKVTEIIDTMVETDKEIKNISNPLQKEYIAEEILRRVGLSMLNDKVHKEALELANNVTKQAQKLVKNNPSGLYVKSEGVNGKTYGKNTEVIKDLSPIFAGINQRLNPNPTSSVNIQNNQQINTTSTDFDNLTEVEASQAYQKLIK